jgi:hypothetical protein
LIYIDKQLNNNKQLNKALMNKIFQSSKFKDIPTDAETIIISRKSVMIDGIEALHENWQHDCFSAESIIFIDTDIKNHSQENIESKIIGHFGLNPETIFTVKNNEKGFTFFNYNFADNENLPDLAYI